MRLLTNLHMIDRRIMYLLLAVFIFIPLHWNKLSMPLPIMPEVRSTYNTIQQMKEGQIALIFDSWGPGTAAENRIQTEALMRHLFKHNTPFMLICFDQQGTKLAEKSAEDIAKQMGKEEGIDWISSGFRPMGAMQLSKGIIQDLNATLKVDRNGKKLSAIPMMVDKNTKKVKTINNIGLVVEATASGSVGGWIAFLCQPKQIPLIYCPTSVMVPEGYNYIDSKQVAGMLPGLVGAAQYDKLVNGEAHKKLFSYRGSNALSWAHALIILLIILGNVGYFMSRRQTGRA